MYNLATNIPCEHFIILANTATYGGGGIYNSYTLTTAHHPSFRPVVVHEFGHSFGGLGDEYFYETADNNDEMHSLSHEPWEPNITTLVDFESKWADMVAEGVEIPTKVTEERSKNYVVGVYEGGNSVFRYSSSARDFISPSAVGSFITISEQLCKNSIAARSHASLR